MTSPSAVGGRDREGMLVDPLTGAFSRALLETRLTEERERARRAATPYSVCVLDIDYFKSVNDAYGHRRGDDVLRRFVQRVSTLLRASDLLFRLGGDEFVLLLPATPRERAQVLAQRIVDGVAATPFPGEPPLSLTVSMGVASWPEDAEDPLARADERSYRAKREGRGRAVAGDGATPLPPQGTRSRLIERDAAMSAAQQFLARLPSERRLFLRVMGPGGSGRTRFLEELSRAAHLRGLDVLAVGGRSGARPHPDPAGASPADWSPGRGAGLLITADHLTPTDEDAVGLVRGLLADPSIAPVGLAATGAWDALRDGLPEIPAWQDIELHPWSRGGLQVWLRTALRDEPDPRLLDWLAERTGGLPGAVEAELVRLAEREALRPAPGGGWTLQPGALPGGAAEHHHLPPPLNAFVGREREIEQVARLLRDRRLVTLVGPGGIGKTRLALEVASLVRGHYAQGAHFVELAEVATEELVVSAIADTLGLSEAAGVSRLDALTAHLRHHSALLVLDNFEQAIAAAPIVPALLQAAPGLRVLVTSREKLHLYGEQVFAVPPLDLPELDPLSPDGRLLESLHGSSAVALFVARASDVVYGFRLHAQDAWDVAALCRRLEGLPLAIELAAVRTDLLTPAQLLAQLGSRLDLLVDGPRDLPARQRTLRGAIDWSFGLLPEADRALFAALGVFTGGWVLEAAEAITGDGRRPVAPRLAALTDKSLVRRLRTEAGPRYLMLEAIREYAVRELARRGELATLRDRHADWYLQLAERADAELIGPDQGRWLDRLEDEHLNLRAALQRFRERGDADALGRMCAALWKFWVGRGHLTEGRRCLEYALGGEQQVAPLVRGRMLNGAGVLASIQGDVREANGFLEEGLEIARALDHPPLTAAVLNNLGHAALQRNDHVRARGWFEEGLALRRRHGMAAGVAASVGNLGEMLKRQGELGQARELLSESLELNRTLGNTLNTAIAANNLGEVALLEGELAAAEELLGEGLRLGRDLADDDLTAQALHGLGGVARRRAALTEARGLLTEALVLRWDLGEKDETALSLEELAAVAVGAGDPALAARLLGAADGLRAAAQVPVAPVFQGSLRRLVATLRTTLDSAAFLAAWSGGRAAPLAQLIAELRTSSALPAPPRRSPVA